jgi:uncharacterized protein YdhG (YjbR/CyaY superfamily)
MERAQQYINALPDAEQQEFYRIIDIVKKTAPDAEFDFAYGLPAFKYKGKPLLYIGAFKDHMSLFPTSGPIAELEKDLQDFKAAKGTLRFTLEKTIPDNIITKLIEVRIAQIG